ncbi:acyl-CoA dehydrogenase family protein [Calditrichota bacterium]
MANKKSLPSFSKSLFSGFVLEELVFPYPIPDKAESENLELILETFRKFAADNIDSSKFDELEEIPTEVVDGFKELGFFGLVIPEEYGGFGLTSTSFVRILEEAGKVDGSIALLLGAHQSIGLKGLLLFGTEDQKKKYLPKLATGELIGAYCLTEPGAGSDAGGIKMRAVRDEKRGIYTLNGTKMWITNGGIADFFTVFAKEEIEMPDGEKKDKITAFMVTRDMGVTSGKHEKKLGIRAVSTTEVIFDNVDVPLENVIGERGKGFKVAMAVLNSGRVGLAGGSVGGSKTVLKQTIAHVNERHQFNRPLADFELIKEKIAQIAIDIYVGESMTYLTTSLIDRGDVDYSLESAMSKVFTTDNLWLHANEALQNAGGIGYSQEYTYEQWVRDARINPIFEGTNEILRFFVALSGMQERGEYLKNIGVALKDPIKGFGVLSDYAVHYVKDRLKTERIRNVHASIAESKALFENWAKNLHITVERILMKHGKKIIQRQIIQKRIADSVIDLYAMIATISRTDLRIKAKGVKKTKKEILYCNTFCNQAWRRVRRNLLMVDKNSDRNILEISEFIKEEEQYLI